MCKKLWGSIECFSREDVREAFNVVSLFDHFQAPDFCLQEPEEVYVEASLASRLYNA